MKDVKCVKTLIPYYIGKVIKITTLLRQKPNSDELDYKSITHYVGILEGYTQKPDHTIVKLKGLDRMQFIDELHYTELYLREEDE